MDIEHPADAVVVAAADYRLVLEGSEGRRVRLLRPRSGELVADLLVPSACDADGQTDRPGPATTPSVVRKRDEVHVEIDAPSSLWPFKRYVFVCHQRELEHYVVLEDATEGRHLDRLHYFCTSAPGPDPLTSSVYAFRSVFDPEPNAMRKQYFLPSEYATIGVTSDKGYHRGNWFFTPGPFCYAVSLRDGQWMTLGLAVRPGEGNFTEFEYLGGWGFGLRLRYDGYTCVAGRWESPHLVMLFAGDEYGALQKYCGWLRERGYAPEGPPCVADWWREPIFCGWGEQVYLAARDGGRATEYAAEPHYRRFLSALEARGLRPGTLVLDDKWQALYGYPKPDSARWPHLGEFIAEQHAARRRVLLWLKAWDPEGLAPEDCMRDREGRLLAADPTSPSYERKLRGLVRSLVGDLGADGFKIDFTHLCPSGPGCQVAGQLWGVELLKLLLGAIRDEARRARPDALLMAHTANPYFADVVDMVRLNDIAVVPGREDESYLESMIHRARVARAALPSALIDTDNWPSPDRATWLEYVRAQPNLGVPSLYYVTHVGDNGEEIREGDWQELRQAWRRYRGSLSQ